MAIQQLQAEDGSVIRVGERMARAMVESGRFSYLTGALAETQAPRKAAKKAAKKKPGRPKKETPAE
jgi:hypothetical protein